MINLKSMLPQYILCIEVPVTIGSYNEYGIEAIVEVVFNK